MKKVKAKIKRFVKERGWEKQLPDHVAKSISIESAELLEIFQWSNPTAKELKKDSQKMLEIKGELADILIYAVHLANILELDIEKIIEAKLLFAAKKYPAKIMKELSVNSNFAGKEYLKIKKAHRVGK